MNPIAVTTVVLIWGIMLGAWIRCTPRDPWTTKLLKGVTICPLTGVGLLSVSWFLGLFVGAPTWAPAIMLLLSFFLIRLARTESIQLPREKQDSGSLWILLPVFLGLGLTLTSMLLDQEHGEGGADAMAIWNYAARFLHRSGSQYPDLMPFLDPSHHMDYPLFFPAAIAAQWHYVGEESWFVVQWTHALFIVPMGTLVYEIVHARRSACLAAWTSAVVLLTPSLLIWGQRQYVDGHLSYAVLGGAGFLALQRAKKDSNPIDATTAGLFLGTMPWIKNEGIPLLFLFAGLHFLAELKRKSWREHLGFTLRLAFSAMVFLVALILFKTNWPPTNDLIANGKDSFFDYLSSGDRWRTVLGAYKAELNPANQLSRSRWAAALLVTVILLLDGLRRRFWRLDPTSAFLMFASFLSIGGWIVVYVVTPQEIHWHMSTSMNRLILQILPLCLVSGVLLCTKAPKADTD